MGPPQHSQVNVELGPIQRADLELNIGAGQLNLRGGAKGLLEGSFEYAPAAMKPELRTSMIGSQASVTIKQPDNGGPFHGTSHYRWDLALNNRPGINLTINVGAGQANLSLGDLRLRNVEVSMGAGQVDLDLRGKPAADYDVHVSGGVGQATVHLPEGVGIRADVHGGIGSISVTGLDKQGDHYENAQYDKAPVNVRLTVDGGIGEIRIIG
jgi:hypothetical protein